MKSTILKTLSLLLTLSLSPLAKAAHCEIALSGTNFNNAYEDHYFVDIPNLHIPPLNDDVNHTAFKQLFRNTCLEQMALQFSPDFLNAEHSSGISYQNAITQSQGISTNLEKLADWVLENTNLSGAEEELEDIPNGKIHFLVTDIPVDLPPGMLPLLPQAPKCMHASGVFQNTEIEFIVHVKRVED